ncbi:MAG: hypothetical protein ABI867_01790 [Kofleriaceae bacterium]
MFEQSGEIVTRTIIALVSFAALAIILATAPSWGEGEPEEEPVESSTDEPITGSPSTPNPGSETPIPVFQPYSIGPPEAAWLYEDLRPDEQAVVDSGRTQPGWDATNAAFAVAARERSVLAKAEAAAIQLGIDGVEIGVLP